MSATAIFYGFKIEFVICRAVNTYTSPTHILLTNKTHLITMSMTKDELFQKLNEVAEFKMPKLSASEIKISKQKAKGKGRPSAEEKYQEEHEEVFLDLFEGINPTMSPELVKVHIKPQDCEDCGKHLTESREMNIKFYKKVPGHISHWRKHCKNCNKYKDPNTGEFTLSQGPACQVYLNWAKSEFSARNKQRKKELDK